MAWLTKRKTEVRKGLKEDVNISFLNEHGIDTEEGTAYTGGKERYISALQRYYRGYGKNRNALEGFLREGNIQDFMIKVHAMKSNSKMIGALEMASAFEKLEMAAKENDRAYIDENAENALLQYDALISLIRPIGEMNEVRIAGEISAAEASDISERLKNALDEFDDELSKELVSKLMGYPFRPALKEKLEKAAGYITEFLYDEALPLIEEVSQGIEG